MTEHKRKKKAKMSEGIPEQDDIVPASTTSQEPMRAMESKADVDPAAAVPSKSSKKKKRSKKRKRAELEIDGKDEADSSGHGPATIDGQTAEIRDHGTEADEDEQKRPDGNEVVVDVNSTPERQGTATVGDEGDPRLVRTLFVGNVSQEATQKDIKKLFKQFGKVETVRMRGVVPVNPKIPKRTAFLTNRLAEFSDSFQAYVVFKDVEDVARVLDEACQKLNMTVFKERHIRVMPAGHKRHGPRKLSMFLGNLPFDCSEEELITAFEQLAENLGVQIVNVRVNRDKDTGVGRGVGFITFSDSLGVQGCINAMGEVKIRGRVLRMEPASKMKKKNTKTHRRANAGNKRKK